MDTSTLQATITQLTAQVATDQTTLTNDGAALATAQAELAQATLINSIESLTPDEVSAVNSGLKSDGSTLSIVDSATPELPETAAPETPPAS